MLQDPKNAAHTPGIDQLSESIRAVAEDVGGVRPNPAGEFHVNDDGGNHVLELARAWSEHLLRQTERVNIAQQRVDWLIYALEKAEPDWGLDEQMMGARSRALWSEQVTLVWTAHQLQQWLRRLDSERGVSPRAWDKPLRDMRDALEHLDDAVIDADGVAQTDPTQPKANRALQAVGGQVLLFSMRLNLEGLSAPARNLLASLADLQDALAEDMYAQEQIDLWRGR